MTDIDDYEDTPDADDEDCEEDSDDEDDYELTREETREELEDYSPYFTEDGVVRITDRAYSRFLKRMSERDSNEVLTEWIERMRKWGENLPILEHIDQVVKSLPEEYQNIAFFLALSPYEMIRQRTIELSDLFDEGMEGDEEGKFKFHRYRNSRY